MDHARRRRDKFRKLKQNTSVLKYLSEFRDIMLNTPDVYGRDWLNRFFNVLKTSIRVEVIDQEPEILRRLHE